MQILQLSIMNDFAVLQKFRIELYLSFRLEYSGRLLANFTALPRMCRLFIDWIVA